MDKKIIPELDLLISNVFCIGRNYSLHAKELGNEVPDNPIVFLKPTSSVCYTHQKITLPTVSNDVHHECEVVVAIGKPGKNIPSKNAIDHIAGIGIGVDLTARDIQQKAKEKGYPWSIAKGFDGFAPIGNFAPIDTFRNINNIMFSLSVNDIRKQTGNTSDMIFSIPDLVAYLSTIFTLQEGDLIFTGTPQGVAQVKSGDHISAELENGQSILQISVS